MIAADLLDVSAPVSAALSDGRPVVALESTIITHGMPFPQNRDTARAVESCVREAGAEPATIALMNGKMRVGLDEHALEQLALEGQSAAKASNRDLASLLAARRMAGTTVATTLAIASLAGIKVFATGGIGGVHHGAELSFDISADLIAMARYPLAVVCAGAKSILDIPKTLEVLETQGVPVLGYQTDDFPAFFTRSSGFGVDYRVNAPDECAAIIRRHWALGLGGLLIANPIPEDAALRAAEIDGVIATALANADAKCIHGKDITPFLLQRIFELTDGRSLEANIALVRHNATIAGSIANALSQDGT